MTVKTRITLFITGAGFMASLLFSVIVFFELIEQPFDLLDDILKEEAVRIVRSILDEEKNGGKQPACLSSGLASDYWIKVYEPADGRFIYQSGLARSVALSPGNPGESVIEQVVIPFDQADPERGGGREMTFRVKTCLITMEGRMFTVQIARPMENLKAEILELVLGLVSGLVFSTLALIAISRFLAGRILKPIGVMKDLAQEINEKNLAVRIPVRDGRDEFSELARTVNRMFDRLQHSFARQKRFLADASHDLKTPLTMMRLLMDRMLSRDPESLSDTDREGLLRLNVQTLRMERLVKNLLDLSSLEIMEGIQSVHLDITSLIQSLLADYRLLADTHHIRLNDEIQPGLILWGDSEKLIRAISNILDNAIKYNRDGGEIQLVAERNDEGVLIRIANTGAGIPETAIDRVFDQFYRVEESRSSKYGGTGLGLTIAKRIVELHGGTILIKSTPSGWTETSLIFPVSFS